MTTAIGAALAGELARSQSIGFSKMEVQSVAVVSGDTAATITAKALSRVDACLVTGGSIALTAQPSLSGAVATLAFTDPAANVFLQVVLLGK